jgi:HEAT repeat protein
MKKGCLVAIVVLIAGGAAVYFAWQSVYNPYYQGRRIRNWADIAIGDPDPAARSEAVLAMTEGFQQLGAGEPRTQFLIYLCVTHQNYRGKKELPKEMLSFLIERLHAGELPSNNYAVMALTKVETDAAITALVDVLLHEGDAYVRDGALRALDLSRGKPAAVAALRRALDTENEKVRERAADALKRLEQ